VKGTGTEDSAKRCQTGFPVELGYVRVWRGGLQQD
jgi:hypothetical protein